ncbi:hemerythrin-like metal-binding protein [Thiorhodococcus drewsii AZ1]|uniref:Hemerythrin-like metal-binding protein n=1 Tax=Thiorhodococcus drewsii AZ1 TaxID=765913 RepID=G2E1T9_9GAMM|nr:bacteriohemerythrin [Thiorhodococcus drewsii]EGV31147.1 hemerythrin-like metal-binding protein [Thiorhodococcus drewsii AZ1]
MIDIEWDNKFSVGHERIDHEHQVFLDLIKNVSLCDDEHMPRERVFRLLTEIGKYADFHFYSEENIMLDTGYPDYEAHKREHSMLLCKLYDYIHRYRVEDIDLDSMVEFLFEWFALHTTGSDKRLVKHIQR